MAPARFEFWSTSKSTKKHNLFSVLGSQKTVVLLGLPRPPWIPVHSFRRSAAETSSGLGAASAAADTSSPQVSADQFQLHAKRVRSAQMMMNNTCWHDKHWLAASFAGPCREPKHENMTASIVRSASLPQLRHRFIRSHTRHTVIPHYGMFPLVAFSLQRNLLSARVIMNKTSSHCTQYNSCLFGLSLKNIKTLHLQDYVTITVLCFHFSLL